MPSHLQLDNCLPGEPVRDRFREWVTRLEQADGVGSFRQVYGGYWNMYFSRVGLGVGYLNRELDLRFWALSGGYGLLPENRVIASYSATLSREKRLPNVVSEDFGECCLWWRLLGEWNRDKGRVSSLVEMVEGADHTIVVAGGSYGRVLGEAEEVLPVEKVTYIVGSETDKPVFPEGSTIVFDPVLRWVFPRTRALGFSGGALGYELVSRLLLSASKLGAGLVSGSEGVHGVLVNWVEGWVDEGTKLASGRNSKYHKSLVRDQQVLLRSDYGNKFRKNPGIQERYQRGKRASGYGDAVMEGQSSFGFGLG